MRLILWYVLCTYEQCMFNAKMKERKLKKYDHWKRRGESLVNVTTEGEVCARLRRGRRKQEWMDNIREWRGGMDRARRIAITRNAHGSSQG